jgi:hypothetical protein
MESKKKEEITLMFFILIVGLVRNFDSAPYAGRLALMQGKNLFVTLSAVEGQKVLEKQQENGFQKYPSHSLQMFKHSTLRLQFRCR